MQQALWAKTEMHFSIEVSFFKIPLSGILKKLFLCVLCGSAVKSFLDKCDTDYIGQEGTIAKDVVVIIDHETAAHFCLPSAK